MKKLGTVSTFFSLLKGFLTIGFLYTPKNFLNGGWLFSLFCIALSFFVTYYCLVRLLQAKEAVPHAINYADVARTALGIKGMYITDTLIAIMQYGFVISLLYFTIKNLKDVVDGILGYNVDRLYLGKGLLISFVGLFVFAVTAPLCLVRKIEKFSFTYIFADMLIFGAWITILIYATLHISEKKVWG